MRRALVVDGLLERCLDATPIPAPSGGRVDALRELAALAAVAAVDEGRMGRM
jgi:hypothetical protein